MELNRPSPYGSNPRFMNTFRKMMAKKKGQGGALYKQPKGVDLARGLGQAKAAVKGRDNVRRTPPADYVDPVKAAMQHSVRNRSQEQGSNAISKALGGATGANGIHSVIKFLGGK